MIISAAATRASYYNGIVFTLNKAVIDPSVVETTYTNGAKPWSAEELTQKSTYSNWAFTDSTTPGPWKFIPEVQAKYHVLAMFHNIKLDYSNGDVKIKGSVKATARVIIGSYSGNRLIDVSEINYNEISNGVWHVNDFTEGNSIKVMLWDGIIPLVKAFNKTI